MANHNPNRGEGFPFPNTNRRRGDSSPNEYRMKIEIFSFSGNLDIESFLDRVYKVEKFFDMAYVPRKSMSSSWRTSSKEEQSHGTSCKSQGGAKETTCDDMTAYETTSLRLIPSTRLPTDSLQPI